MKFTSLILSMAFGSILLLACNERTSKMGASDAVSEPTPQTALEWANHGTRLLNKGLPEQALASYDRALLLDTTNPYTYCSKASAYHKLGQPELALQSADKALQVDPGYTPAMGNKARALRKLGREAEADSLLKYALSIESTMKRHVKK